MERIFELFDSVQSFYSEELRISINFENQNTRVYFSNPLFYNYILVDGEVLKTILENYNTMDLREPVISAEDHIEFRKGCFYAGKGKSDRKFTHLVKVKNSSQMELVKNAKEFKKFGKRVKVLL